MREKVETRKKKRGHSVIILYYYTHMLLYHSELSQLKSEFLSTSPTPEAGSGHLSQHTKQRDEYGERKLFIMQPRHAAESGEVCTPAHPQYRHEL
jgi:hypothetical protein